MKEEARRILIKAFQEQGEKLFSNRALCLSLLRDYGGNNHHEFTLLAESVDVGIPQRLSSFANGDFDAGVAEAMACDFRAKRYYEIDFCRWVVGSWAMCFGLSGAASLVNVDSPMPSAPANALWYYIVDDQTLGPTQEDALLRDIKAGALNANILVWTEGKSEWKTAGEQFNLQQWPPISTTISSNAKLSTTNAGPSSGIVLFYPISIKKLVVMSIFTGGFFNFYWFYKNWGLVKTRTTQKISPSGRAFWAIFYCYSLFKKVKDAALRNSISAPFSPGWITLAYIGLTLLCQLPGLVSIGSFAAFLPIMQVQKTINLVNSKVAPGADTNDIFTVLNIVTIVICVLFWVFIFFCIATNSQQPY